MATRVENAKAQEDKASKTEKADVFLQDKTRLKFFGIKIFKLNLMNCEVYCFVDSPIVTWIVTKNCQFF